MFILNSVISLFCNFETVKELNHKIGLIPLNLRNIRSQSTSLFFTFICQFPDNRSNSFIHNDFSIFMGFNGLVYVETR